MRLLPYQKFVINTKQLPTEVKQVLTKVTALTPKDNTQSNKFFSGEVNTENFKISRILVYRNSFNPIIRGKYSNTTRGTQIAISMGLPKVVIFFLTVWCVMDLGIMLFAIVNTIATGKFDTFFLFGLLSLVFAYGFALIGFNREAGAAKETLTQLF